MDNTCLRQLHIVRPALAGAVVNMLKFALGVDVHMRLHGGMNIKEDGVLAVASIIQTVVLLNTASGVAANPTVPMRVHKRIAHLTVQRVKVTASTTRISIITGTGPIVNYK